MKQILFSIFCFAFSLSLFAQNAVIQNGMVRELNSDKTAIGGVFIKFEDAVNTNSDDEGNFRLAFQGKKAGDIIFF